MNQTKEWGEFFPHTLSPFEYNETVTNEYFPLTSQEAESQGYTWKNIPDPDFSGVTKKIPAEKLPDQIQDIPDDILNWALECEESRRLYKIQKSELEFYRKMNLPIPHYSPDVRHLHRMRIRNPRKLFRRKCFKCQKQIQTTYAPDRPEPICCEQCYLAKVY
jgi:hypothetical protein